jgi:hypothetical protein
VGANGEGETLNDAVADLREALEGLIAEFGVPDAIGFAAFRQRAWDSTR